MEENKVVQNIESKSEMPIGEMVMAIMQKVGEVRGAGNVDGENDLLKIAEKNINTLSEEQIRKLYKELFIMADPIEGRSSMAN
jgi:hypothetical protein